MYLNQELHLKMLLSYILCYDISSTQKHMVIPQEKIFYVYRIGSNIIDDNKFRFDAFVLFIEKWLRRHLKVK